MFKIILPTVLLLAFSCPTVSQAQGYGCCDAAPTCQKTRKKLALVDVTKSITRLKRVCETDACGCTSTKLRRVSQCVTRKRLALVDVPVDPCKRSVLKRLRDKLKNLKLTGRRKTCGGCDTCDSCDGSGASCGCDSAVQAYGAGDSYPNINYPTESFPTESYSAAPYSTDAGVPLDISYPAESGYPTEAAPLEGSIIN